MLEFNKIDRINLVSNPPVKSEATLLVFFIKERIIYPHLSTHLSIIFKLSLVPRGILFSLLLIKLLA